MYVYRSFRAVREINFAKILPRDCVIPEWKKNWTSFLKLATRFYKETVNINEFSDKIFER